MPTDLAALASADRFSRTRALARLITGLEAGTVPANTRDALLAAAAKTAVPALGVTGTGGAGKSSLTDEIVRRFRLDQQDGLKIAVISIDPSRRKSGGALLGDRIRMNAIEHPNIYMGRGTHRTRPPRLALNPKETAEIEAMMKVALAARPKLPDVGLKAAA